MIIKITFSKSPSQQWFFVFTCPHELLISLRMSSYAMADVEILLWLIMTFITLTTCTIRTTRTSVIFTLKTRTSGVCWTWLICATNKLTILLPKKVQAHLSQSQPLLSQAKRWKLPLAQLKQRLLYNQTGNYRWNYSSQIERFIYRTKSNSIERLGSIELACERRRISSCRDSLIFRRRESRQIK